MIVKKMWNLNIFIVIFAELWSPLRGQGWLLDISFIYILRHSSSGYGNSKFWWYFCVFYFITIDFMDLRSFLEIVIYIVCIQDFRVSVFALVWCFGSGLALSLFVSLKCYQKMFVQTDKVEVGVRHFKSAQVCFADVKAQYHLIRS